MLLPPDADDEEFCDVTTRGRVTGRPHEIEIWFARDTATLHLLSGGGHRADWVRNLEADPSVTVRLRDVTYTAIARVLQPGTPEDRAARDRVFAKYAARGYDGLDGWRERALVVALDVHDPVPRAQS